VRGWAHGGVCMGVGRVVVVRRPRPPLGRPAGGGRGPGQLGRITALPAARPGGGRGRSGGPRHPFREVHPATARDRRRRARRGGGAVRLRARATLPAQAQGSPGLAPDPTRVEGIVTRSVAGCIHTRRARGGACPRVGQRGRRGEGAPGTAAGGARGCRDGGGGPRAPFAPHAAVRPSGAAARFTGSRRRPCGAARPAASCRRRSRRSSRGSWRSARPRCTCGWAGQRVGGGGGEGARREGRLGSAPRCWARGRSSFQSPSLRPRSSGLCLPPFPSPAPPPRARSQVTHRPAAYLAPAGFLQIRSVRLSKQPMLMAWGEGRRGRPPPGGGRGGGAGGGGGRRASAEPPRWRVTHGQRPALDCVAAAPQRSPGLSSRAGLSPRATAAAAPHPLDVGGTLLEAAAVGGGDRVDYRPGGRLARGRLGLVGGALHQHQQRVLALGAERHAAQHVDDALQAVHWELGGGGRGKGGRARAGAGGRGQVGGARGRARERRALQARAPRTAPATAAAPPRPPALDALEGSKTLLSHTIGAFTGHSGGDWGGIQGTRRRQTAAAARRRQLRRQGTPVLLAAGGAAMYARRARRAHPPLTVPGRHDVLGLEHGVERCGHLGGVAGLRGRALQRRRGGGGCARAVGRSRAAARASRRAPRRRGGAARTPLPSHLIQGEADHGQQQRLGGHRGVG
jgi:hypothetical protein